MQFQSWLENRMEIEQIKKQESRAEGEFEGIEQMNVLQAQPPPVVYKEDIDPETAEGVADPKNCESYVTKWLFENKLHKLSQAFIENEVAVDDLLDFASNHDDALEFCNDNNIKHLTKMRFIRALQKLPSKRAAQNNNDSKAPAASFTVSPEEEKALNVIETSMHSNKAQIDNLSEIQLPQLTQALQQNTAVIESIFEEITKCAMDQKNELLQELNKKTHHKQQQIRMQINDLQQRQKRFDQWHQRSQFLSNDVSCDPSQRKMEILDLCKKTLSITPSVTQSITDLTVKKQETQMAAIKVKLTKVVLIEDASDRNKDIAERKEDEPQPLESQKIKSQDVQLSKSKKRKQRKKKNKPSYAMKTEINTGNAAPPPSVKTPVPKPSIVVQNRYEAVKEEKAVGDSWDAYPMKESQGQPPRGYKLNMCRFYYQYKNCRNGVSCTYAHGEKELKKYNPYIKTRICTFVERKLACPHMTEIGWCNHIHPKNNKK